MSDARLVARRVGACLKLDYPPGDLLPGANAFVIAPEREGTNLLGNVDWGLRPVRFKHRAGAGPQFPIAQWHWCPRQ